MRLFLIATLVAALLAVPGRAQGYSVLTHEANIDALIQDLGYYPFGSKFFSNLVHYVRSGEFVEALITNAGDLNEYAFAIGALGHYLSDNNGHPIAVNRSVPLVYPKMEAKFGDIVTYEQSPKRHIMVEFSFVVVQVAAGAFAPQAYHSFIGFEVSKPLLERTFQQFYGLELKKLFLNEDLAIGTYRHAVAKDIPEMTKVAWKKKRQDIEKVTPGITEAKFVFNLSQQQYEKEFGTDYAKPRGYAPRRGSVSQLADETYDEWVSRRQAQVAHR